MALAPILDDGLKVVVYGFLTDRVALRRGVRQGYSLSPLPYILCVEALACQIRNNPDIEGFLLPGAGGPQYKVRQYADDTTSFVKNYRSLMNLFKSVRVYELGSGAKLNGGYVAEYVKIQNGAATWPHLGNWMPKLKKLQSHLNLWKRRSLSLVGRALLVKALGLSKLNYLASVLIVPNWVKNKVNEVIWPFLWRKKFETVSRQTCFCAKLKGCSGNC